MSKQDLIKMGVMSLIISIISSSSTYFLLKRSIPRFATIDLLYLSNDYIVDLAKYKMNHGAKEGEIRDLVSRYSDNIQPLLNEISKRGNLILFQKQAIVSDAPDITDKVEKALFADQTVGFNNPDKNEFEY